MTIDAMILRTRGLAEQAVVGHHTMNRTIAIRASQLTVRLHRNIPLRRQCSHNMPDAATWDTYRSKSTVLIGMNLLT